MELRDYQIQARDSLVSDLSTTGKALLVMSMGLGKTEVSLSVAKHYLDQGKKVTFLVNKSGLVDQTHKRANSHGMRAEAFCASLGSKERGMFTVASVQSFVKAPHKNDLLIIDECHRLKPDDDSQFMKVVNYHDCHVMGMTATPYRHGGYIYGEDDSFWPQPSFERGLLWAIENGWLVPPITKKNNVSFDTSNIKIRLGDYDQKALSSLVSDEQKAMQQVKDALSHLDGRKKVVWATTNIEHCELVTKILRETGEKAVAIHSKMVMSDREIGLHWFEEQDCRHLVFVTIVSEGYDYPPVDGVVLCRPTRSPTLYCQTVGRALRVSGDKKNSIILDYGNVINTLGPLDNPIIPKKGSRSSGEENKIDKDWMFCPGCQSYVQRRLDVCPECDFDFKAAREKANYQKNLERINRVSEDILSGGVKAKSSPFAVINPDYTKITPHITKSGANAFKIQHYKGFRVEIHYAVFGSEWWQQNTAIKIMNMLGIRGSSYTQIRKIVGSELRVFPKEVTLDKSGFPKLISVRFK